MGPLWKQQCCRTSIEHNDSVCNPTYYAVPSQNAPCHVGFGLVFAKAYSGVYGRNVLLMPCAKGWQLIAALAKGGALYSDKVLRSRTQAAVASCKGKVLRMQSVLGHQGDHESDAYGEGARRSTHSRRRSRHSFPTCSRPRSLSS